jgi:hypothetical protein
MRARTSIVAAASLLVFDLGVLSAQTDRGDLSRLTPKTQSITIHAKGVTLANVASLLQDVSGIVIQIAPDVVEPRAVQP